MAIAKRPGGPVAAPVAAPAAAKASLPTPPVAVALGDRTEQRVPMTRLRARIAERLLQSQQTNAILTTFNEVNMGPMMALRKQYGEKFEKTHGVRLGFMGFFVKAACAALQKFPAGDCYQINYTFPLTFDWFGTPLDLYARLRDRQPVRYGGVVCDVGGGNVRQQIDRSSWHPLPDHQSVQRKIPWYRIWQWSQDGLPPHRATGRYRCPVHCLRGISSVQAFRPVAWYEA